MKIISLKYVQILIKFINFDSNFNLNMYKVLKALENKNEAFIIILHNEYILYLSFY